MNTHAALQLIKANSGQLTSTIINDLISEHSALHSRMKRDYDRYKAESLPIQARLPVIPDKVCNKINNDYRGEIVDQGVGYLFGKPITYRLNKLAYEGREEQLKADQATLQDFLKTSFIEDLDKEAGKKSSICGTAARLCYIDKQGRERAMNIPPWEVIFIQDASLDETQYALRYYDIQDIVNGKAVTRTRVEWYDKETVTFYISVTQSAYELDLSVEKNPMPHFFDMVPLVEFPNNEERINDFRKVEANIDAYDRAVSVAQDEIEEFRNAYLAFTGCTLTKEQIAMARETGAFSVPGDGAEVKFLIKDINGTFYENHKKTLKENTYRFSSTVDMSSETFSGSGASGETRKWLLLALEFRAGTKQLKFAKSLVQMFQVLSSAWKTKSSGLNWKNIEFNFDRNIPVELVSEATIQRDLKGNVSDELRLSLFSPCRNVDEEMRRQAKENEGAVNLDTIPPEEPEEKEAAYKAAEPPKQ